MSGHARPLRKLLPGGAIAAAVAAGATGMSLWQGGPQMLYALFFGVAFHALGQELRHRPGIEFCARQVLRLGVGLLGARITAMQIAGLGWPTALTVVAAVVSTLLCGLLLARWLGMTPAQGVLSGGAVAICGASAALAIAAVLPRDKHQDRSTLMVVLTVTVLSTVAMVLYPMIARALDLPPALAGLFIGASIHDVAQVVGAGYTLGPVAGDVATIVKLMRVAMLAAVVLAVSLAFKAAREQAAGAEGTQAPGARPAARQPLVPWFLWLFAALVALHSASALPAWLQQGMGTLSRACLVVAITALGMKTSFMQLAQAGWRPVLLITLETVWIATLTLAVIVWLR